MSTGARSDRGAEDWVALDLETTGFSPVSDRIVEIGVVRFDAAGREIASWATILDPERDPGPTDVHGIGHREVRGAPRFSEIAHELVWRLGGARIVAHNASFDRGFLVTELGRVGADWSGAQLVCSMRASRHAGIGPKNTLAACCEALGISNPAAHSALADARAAGQVLITLLPALAGFTDLAAPPAPWAPPPARLARVRQRGQ